jgi:hypothetical protein
MRSITVNLYSFDELSDKAKEKALEELYSVVDYAWHSENTATLEAIEKAFKLERFEWAYSEYSCDYSFTVPHDLKQGMNKKAIKRLFANHLNDGFWLTEFFKSDFMTAFEKYGDIKSALKHAVNEAVKCCHKDMADYFSEESLAEHAIANDYEFREDGGLA